MDGFSFSVFVVAAPELQGIEAWFRTTKLDDQELPVIAGAAPKRDYEKVPVTSTCWMLDAEMFWEEKMLSASERLLLELDSDVA